MTTPRASFVPSLDTQTHKLGDFSTFAARVLARLERGRQSYGDESFTLSPDILSEEIEQEILDMMGWGYILWCRLRELESRVGIKRGPVEP